MAVTQKEIAANLGVSRELVKFALSGTGRVSAEARQRIIAEAARLGYTAQHNRAARSLIARRYGRRVRTDIIAVLMPEAFFGGIALPRVPFFAPFIEGIEQAAGEQGLDIFLCSSRLGALPRLLEAGEVDGVISVADSTARLRTMNLPVVNFGRPGDGWAVGIHPDNYRGGQLATQHLIDLGHREIACLGFAPGEAPDRLYQPAHDRNEGYRDALANARIHFTGKLFLDDIVSPDVDSGVAAMGRLLARDADFTGVVCFNDLIAMGAIQALRAAGRRVPQDVSVIGFDDVSLQYPLRPLLTSIAFDRFAMGRRAVDLICEARAALEEGQTLTNHDESFAVQLVQRASTGVPPREMAL